LGCNIGVATLPLGSFAISQAGTLNGPSIEPEQQPTNV
jgi:hypothetical protein